MCRRSSPTVTSTLGTWGPERTPACSAGFHFWKNHMPRYIRAWKIKSIWHEILTVVISGCWDGMWLWISFAYLYILRLSTMGYIPFVQRKTTLLKHPKDLLCFSVLVTCTRAHDVGLWRPVSLKGHLKFLFLDVLMKMERHKILKNWASGSRIYQKTVFCMETEKHNRSLGCLSKVVFLCTNGM